MTDTSFFENDPVVGDDFFTQDPIADQAPRPNSLQSVLSTLTNEFLAAFQGTSPIITGEREPLGELKNFDFGPGFLTEDGEAITANLDDHVILRDPETNKIMVFERTEGTNEGSLVALGRLLGFGTLASPLAATRSTASAQRVQDAVEAGIEPNIAAATQSRGAKVIQNTLGDTPIAGSPVARQAERIPQQGAQRLEEIVSEVGGATDAAGAGSALRRGTQSFVGTRSGANLTDDVITDAILKPARSTSFLGKTEALYQRAFNRLEGIGDVDMGTTLESLDGAIRRFDNTDLGRQFVNPRLEQWAGIIRESQGRLSLNDLRQFRSEVGALLSRPAVLKDIDDAQLSAVYSALSKDMARAAAEVGPEAVQSLKRADQFYSAGRQRISGALKQLTDVKRADENLFQTIQRTTNVNTGDINKLNAVRRSMPDEEWDIFVSTFLRDMGTPTPGAINLGDQAQFSVDTFITNFAKLSPKAKEIMFGNRASLRQGLDKLANVLSAQKEVARTANTSRTGSAVITAGVTASAFNAPVQTALGLVGARVAAQLMTNPRFVAWWVKGLETTNIPGHIERLALVAKGDQDLAQAVAEFRAKLGGQ